MSFPLAPRVDLNEKYFNAGILVINLKLWREKNIGMRHARCRMSSLCVVY